MQELGDVAFHREAERRYRLLIKRDTVENHTIDFRGSSDYQDFRKLVADCFAAAPEVEHTQQVGAGF